MPPTTRFGSNLTGEYLFAAMAGWLSLFVGFASAKRAFYRSSTFPDVMLGGMTASIVLAQAKLANAARYGTLLVILR